MTQDIWRWLLKLEHVTDEARNTGPINNIAVGNDGKENGNLLLPHWNSQERLTTYWVVCFKDIIGPNNSSSSFECPKFSQCSIIFIRVMFVCFVTTYHSAFHRNFFSKVYLKNIWSCERMKASMQFFRLLKNLWDYISNFDNSVKKNWAGQWELKSLNFLLYKTQLCTKCMMVYKGETKGYFAKVFWIYLLRKNID